MLLPARKPTAVLEPPVVRLSRAFCPSAVLLFGYPPSGAGTTACARGNSPKQANANATRIEDRKNIPPTEVFVRIFIMVFFSFLFAVFGL
jgi:hypothetical protein